MAEKAAYTTEKKEEVRVLGRDGEVNTVYRIWATSRRGAYFHVDVPEDQLDEADRLLTARAAKLDAI